MSKLDDMTERVTTQAGHEPASHHICTMNAREILALIECVKAADSLVDAGNCYSGWDHAEGDCSACVTRDAYLQARSRLEKGTP